MKKILVSLVSGACLFAAAMPASAHDSPCGAIMCLSTMGSSPSECSRNIKAYFDIEEKKHGKFSASRTASKRAREINDKCPDADRTSVARIHAKYGGLHKSQNPFKYY